MKSESNADENPNVTELMKTKTEKVESVSEIILCDSGEDVVEEVEVLSEEKENENEIEDENENTKISLRGGHFLEERENSFLRGLLPLESDNSFSSVLNIPVIKRCCIEHCYFIRNRNRSNRTYRYNLRRLPANEINTLQFENKNQLEQQTIDLECLASQEVNSVSKNDSENENIVNNNNKKKRNSISSRSSQSSKSCGSDTEESLVDDSNDQDYCPEENSTATDSDSVSVASVECCDSKNQKVQSIFSSLKNETNTDDRKKSISRHRLGITSYPTTNRIPNNFVSVHDLLTKIRNMQKLMKTKCDKKFVGEPGNTSKIPPPKLRKIINRGKFEDFPKISQYLFPMPNLTKMVPGEKNWRVEYMDDEVQNLGLDDLLLKASELNAENFTKALGRKLDSVKPIINTKDTPEIVFTIPKTKINSVDAEKNCEIIGSDCSKLSNLKTIQLDISKPFFGSDKSKETEAVQEASKTPEATSPKRSGIKVKTVENINEEFKDSLGLKNKTFPQCNLNGVDKEISSKLENRKNLSPGSIFNSSVKDSVMLDNMEREGGLLDLDNKNPEEGRPFIMTIIQSKTEKQRPAILRNSSYFKKKTSCVESQKNVDKVKETIKENRVQTEASPVVEDNKSEDATTSDPQSSKTQVLEKNSFNAPYAKTIRSGSNPEVVYESAEANNKAADSLESRFAIKKRNIPFILSHNRKCKQVDLPVQRNLLVSDSNKTQTAPSKLVKFNEGSDKGSSNEKVFKVTSTEQKLGPKEANQRFIKVVPYEPASKAGNRVEGTKEDLQQQKHLDEDEDKDKSLQKDGKSSHLISLSAFSSILKEILPDKWFLCFDKRYGIQIIKTHLDKRLNPSILISVVIARCGKLTVNVRGKQLEKSHDFFSNLCEMGNSENKLSLNYVLAIINKLRYLSVCFGCDDPLLRKYWSDEGVVEQCTESQQVYRSHLCELLVPLGKRRCYPCYRMNESLKKRYRRDKLEKKIQEDGEKSSNVEEVTEDVEESDHCSKNDLQTKGVKRNLEDFLEESFSTMKQQISDEIEKNKKLGERENALKTQEEVLSFMGLTRKVSMDNPVRKSKRKKKTFFKLQQPVKKKVDQQELEFLEKYWTDINTLFSTSLLFGAYSRTGRGRLREKCRMFQKLLSTWRNIVKSNPDWIGGDINLPEVLNDEDSLENGFCTDQFEKMEAPALRAYIINSVKEVNRIKHKLRTRNSYFKVLYNKFVKRRMKRPKPLMTASEQKGTTSSANSTTNTPTPTDLSSDESSREKERTTDDENKPVSELVETEVAQGEV